MKRRAFTLMEIMVSSGVLLVMVIMTSMATLSYLRAYRHYTSQGLQLRQTAKTLEVLCFHLRSARSMQAPIPTSLRQAPLLFEKKTREHCNSEIGTDNPKYPGSSQFDRIREILEGTDPTMIELTSQHNPPNTRIVGRQFGRGGAIMNYGSLPVKGTLIVR